MPYLLHDLKKKAPSYHVRLDNIENGRRHVRLSWPVAKYSAGDEKLLLLKQLHTCILVKQQYNATYIIVRIKSSVGSSTYKLGIQPYVPIAGFHIFDTCEQNHKHSSR